MRLCKGDIVQVITGDDSKGKEPKTGKVIEVDRERDRVLVQGVNFVWKHLRRSQQHPHGARIQKEASIAASNVRVLCQSCNKPTKIVIKRTDEGGRARICRKCRQDVTPEA